MPERDNLPGPIIFSPEDDVEDEALTEASEDVYLPTEYIRWTSPSRVFDPKSARWFLGVFFVGLVAIVVLAILREIWLALFVAASVFVLYALARVEPGEIEHGILTNGIETAGRLFEWGDLNSYWIYESKGVVVLRLDTKLLLPHIVELLLPAETPDDDVEELDELLQEYLPKLEKPHAEMGNVADAAILSVADKLPGQQRILKWVGKNLGLK